jgi:hypothetical protein
MTPITLTGQYAVRRDPYTPVTDFAGPDRNGEFVGKVDGLWMVWDKDGDLCGGDDDMSLIPLAVRPVAPLRCWAQRGPDGGIRLISLDNPALGADIEMIEAEPIRAAAQDLVEALRAAEKRLRQDGWIDLTNMARKALAAWESRQ